jgi:cytochrome c peroxidase
MITARRTIAVTTMLMASVCANIFGIERTSQYAVAASTEDSISAIAELGSRLFADTRLSSTGDVSCATCHVPELAFSDGLPVAIGVNAQRGTRNTPSLWNVSSLPTQFWDGRRATLETQALDPFLNAREHGLAGEEQLLAAIRRNPAYNEALRAAFEIAPEQLASHHVAVALAAFQRTLQLEPSPFDRHHAGYRSVLSDAEARGLELFEGRAGCARCHTVEARHAPLTDHQFHSIGVGLDVILPRLAVLTRQVAKADGRTLDRLIAEDPAIAALGRFVVTLDPRDIGKFRTPSLRNVALTAPYMHDGSIATLEAAIEFEVYYRSLQSTHPLILTPAEKADLVAFLRALTSPNARVMPVLSKNSFARPLLDDRS